MGGIASHPNELARATAVFVVFVVILYRDRQLKWAPCFAALLLTAATMWATQSRTSAAAALQALVFVIVRRSPLLLAAGVLLLMIGGGIILLLPAKTLTELLLPFSRSGDFAELLNLTGRVDLWKFIWQKSMEAPLIGHGFNASEYFLSRTYPYFPLDWDPQDAHNMLLQTLLTLGFFGVALLGLFIWRLAVLYLNAPAPYRDAMLGLVLMIGVTGSGAFGVTPNLLTLMMLLTMAAADSARSLSGDGPATPRRCRSPEPLARDTRAAIRPILLR